VRAVTAAGEGRCRGGDLGEEFLVLSAQGGRLGAQRVGVARDGRPGRRAGVVGFVLGKQANALPRQRGGRREPFDETGEGEPALLGGGQLGAGLVGLDLKRGEAGSERGPARSRPRCAGR
jgi:hypothetical protein